jgi:hypothetical protein
LELYRNYHNARYAVEPRSSNDAHRAVHQQHNLELIFSEIEKRSVSKALTLSLDNKTISLVSDGITRTLAGKDVSVHRLPNGEVRLVCQDAVLDYWKVP